MSDDADLSHAIIALAKASAEIGVIFRGFVQQQDDDTKARHETNRWLAKIHDQNGSILTQMGEMAHAARESEREMRVVKSTVKSHAAYLVEVGKAIGLPAPVVDPEPARRAAADR